MLVAYELRETLFPGEDHNDNVAAPSASTRPSVTKMLEALTHRSCHDAIDCERYELLGDCVLRYSTALDIFRCRAEDEDEGGMTMTIDLRVANGTLFRIAQVRLTHWADLLWSATCTQRHYDAIGCERSTYSVRSHRCSAPLQCAQCSADDTGHGKDHDHLQYMITCAGKYR